VLLFTVPAYGKWQTDCWISSKQDREMKRSGLIGELSRHLHEGTLVRRASVPVEIRTEYLTNVHSVTARPVFSVWIWRMFIDKFEKQGKQN
jgi:hypothetical protein